MASFGPVRVALADPQHPVGGPYRVENNPDPPLDAIDLVFIDAPGTGFGTIREWGAASRFYGIDQDATAFALRAAFPDQARSLELAEIPLRPRLRDGAECRPGWQLAQRRLPRLGKADPGVDDPFFLALPSHAAIAWFHNTVSNRPAQLEPGLDEVERHAIGDHAGALLAGSGLTQAARQTGRDLDADEPAARGERVREDPATGIRPGHGSSGRPP